jgi:hypothetical protein
MKFFMETNEGKQVDTSNVKYMTFDGVEYAMMAVVKTKQEEKTDYGVLRNLFGEEIQTHKRTHANSVARKVNDWLNTNPSKGQTQIFVCNTDGAVRVACENRNVKVSLRRVRKNQWAATFEGKKLYARSAKRA